MENQHIIVPIEFDPKTTKGHFLLTHAAMELKPEGLHWLDSCRMDKLGGTKAMNDAIDAKMDITCVNISHRSLLEWTEILKQESIVFNRKKRVHLLALGDVGSTVLMGLKLLGGNVISEIGICDINPSVTTRWEYEMNQTAYPFDYYALPEVNIVSEENLFDCDVFVFCASKGIPPVGSQVKDVRMIQYEENKKIVSRFAKLAREKKFTGMFAVVSDPVDPLCKAAYLASNENANGEFDCNGLLPEQIQGFGLGVMNARAAYYAKKDPKFSSFLTEGRAFGPHGQDLVIANSIANYDDALSKELTKLAVEANLRTREAGFKPYIAPAFSSAAISLVLSLEGKWHYSSNFLGGIYMGCNNLQTCWGTKWETLPLPQLLYERLVTAFANLEAID